MTDLEISKALALAIGWPEAKYFDWLKGVMVTNQDGRGWFEFDYRDWRIIGPIAERFDLFPWKRDNGEWASVLMADGSDTPQKAIAIAVINGVNT